MAIDRIDWHSGADDFPQDLDHVAGGTHIGMFLAWIINNDLVGELHTTESTKSISAVKARAMTGTEFLVNECDEKFWREDLNETGGEFAQFYYESGQYFEDYETALIGNLPSLYHVEDNWDNYDRISLLISRRYIKWQNSKGKQWWQIWK